MLPVRVERRRGMPSRFSDPISDIDLLTNFDRMVDRIFGSRESQVELFPADIWEDDENVHIEMELSGVKSEDVTVSFDDGLLRIEGEKKIPEHKGNVYLTERSFGKFTRTFQLPTSVNPEAIEASFKDGMLFVKCGKKPETKSHKIEIKTT